MLSIKNITLFYFDSLSIIITILVCFIGLIVYRFSKKYMEGDTHYSHFKMNLLVLLLSVIIMAIADNLFLFMIVWYLSNWMLVKLIIHKSTWNASKESGKRANQNFILGFSCIALSFALLYATTGETSIQSIVNHGIHLKHATPILILILLAAMTQSAIWPFHGWLASSLNAPTPVSAIMHAGIVNGGGILLARFARLYLSTPLLLNIIFVVGFITVLLGTLWKLMQHDIKRMLAYSTMAQMGFMFAQCGLGLFPAAIAHLCWHGMFKAYLFLTSGSAAQEKRIEMNYPPRFICFLLALACGIVSSYCFAIMNHQSLLKLNATLLISAMVFITGTQLALPILQRAPFKMLPIAMIVAVIFGLIDGASVYLVDSILSPLNIMHPQPLSIIHLIAIILLLTSWLLIFFIPHINQTKELPNWILRLYVQALNKSQAYPDTITSSRNSYKYQ